MNHELWESVEEESSGPLVSSAAIPDVDFNIPTSKNCFVALSLFGNTISHIILVIQTRTVSNKRNENKL